MNSVSREVAIIILAAGHSSRLGHPKQLLKYKSKTLLRHIADIALASACRPVVVVIPPAIEKLMVEISDLPLQIVENTEYMEGIASSIRVGIKTIRAISSIDAAILVLCDQPLVTTALINHIARIYTASNSAIVACEYDNSLGVPALFSRSLFSELENVHGDRGAKKIIDQHYQHVSKVPFAEGRIDIDTVEDYRALIKDF